MASDTRNHVYPDPDGCKTNQEQGTMPAAGMGIPSGSSTPAGKEIPTGQLSS